MGSPILLKIVSENQFSGKTYFYTIASRESEEFGWHVSKAHGVRSIKCVNCDFVGAHFQEVVRHMRESHGVEVGQGICLVNKAVPIRA